MREVHIGIGREGDRIINHVELDLPTARTGCTIPFHTKTCSSPRGKGGGEGRVPICCLSKSYDH